MIVNTSESLESLDVLDFIHKQKPFWNIAAIIYTLSGYFGGIFLLIQPSLWQNISGIFLLTHCLVYSALLSHEFMHGTIFKSRYWNVFFGKIMLWLNGGCYYSFESLTLQHIAHHVDRVDVFTFDIPKAIKQQHYIVQRCIVALEWFYFPIVSFWSRWRSITAPWWNRGYRKERLHRLVIIAIRVILFGLFGLNFPKALCFYFLSYIGMMTLLRFMDAFQHTYEAFLPGTSLPKRDYEHEQKNTFSNLFSQRFYWLNLLFLNFGYHNAHHAVMKCPWHSLHELDRQMFKSSQVQYISIWKQLVNYHQYRITRLFEGQGKAIDEYENPSTEKFYGAVDVSFITLY